jgi:zinc transporter, ZIP family
VLEAFGLGTLAQSSLLLAGLLVCWVAVPTRLVGILAGFGAGAMIAAVSFELVPEARVHIDEWQFALWMFIGVAVFLLGDHLVDARFGSEGSGGALGIVVGSVVDGVPESIIFGIQLGTGIPVSVSFLAAVLVSNVPQAIAPSADLAASGWGPLRLGRLWLLVVLGCGVAAALGYLVSQVSFGGPRRPRGGSRRGRHPRDADQLADAFRVRARGVTRGRSDSRRVLRLRRDELTLPRMALHGFSDLFLNRGLPVGCQSARAND